MTNELNQKYIEAMQHRSELLKPFHDAIQDWEIADQIEAQAPGSEA